MNALYELKKQRADPKTQNWFSKSRILNEQLSF